MKFSTTILKTFHVGSGFVSENGFGASDAVHRSGNDAARITGTLAAGIKAADICLIKLVTQDSDGRGAAAFGKCQHGVGERKAA